MHSGSAGLVFEHRYAAALALGMTNWGLQLIVGGQGVAHEAGGPVARVSAHEQTRENQLIELRDYATARGWTVVEYVDQAVSLDELLQAARRIFANAG